MDWPVSKFRLGPTQLSFRSPHRRRQAFDPTFAAMHLTPAMVDDLMAIEPLAGHDLLDGLKQELPAYLSAAATCPALNRSDVGEYTEAVLAFYRAFNPRFPTWAKAARIIFAMAPSSAASESASSPSSRTCTALLPRRTPAHAPYTRYLWFITAAHVCLCHHCCCMCRCVSGSFNRFLSEFS